MPKCDKCHHNHKGCTIGQLQSKGKGKGKAKAKVIEELQSLLEEVEENKSGKLHIPYLSLCMLTTLLCRFSRVDTISAGCHQVWQACTLPGKC